MSYFYYEPAFLLRSSRALRSMFDSSTYIANANKVIQCLPQTRSDTIIPKSSWFPYFVCLFPFRHTQISSHLLVHLYITVLSVTSKMVSDVLEHNCAPMRCMDILSRRTCETSANRGYQCPNAVTSTSVKMSSGLYYCLALFGSFSSGLLRTGP